MLTVLIIDNRYFLSSFLYYFVILCLLRQPIINMLHGNIAVGGKIFGVPLNTQYMFLGISPGFRNIVFCAGINRQLAVRSVWQHRFGVAGIGFNFICLQKLIQRRRLFAALPAVPYLDLTKISAELLFVFQTNLFVHR